jgi:serine O-acetyltransferase
MRPLLAGDLDMAARVLLARPKRDWPSTARHLLVAARWADRHRRRNGRLHPRFGSGSVMAAGPAFGLAPLPDHAKPDFCRALAVFCWIASHPASHRGLSSLRNVSIWGMNSAKVRPAMATPRTKIAQIDPVWDRICNEAREAVIAEPLMGSLLHQGILHHATFERALAYRISMKLASDEMSEQILREIADEAFSEHPDLAEAARADLVAVLDRDPACHRLLQPLLYFKGYQAVQAYRLGHWLWQEGRKDLAYFVQMRVSEVFGIDIHPAARIGKGIMIDHAHSIVIGETAVVGNNVSMLHSVTLGGTGKADGDRHPKIGDEVLIGAGAKVLGNITVGCCSRIAAGSVVLADVPPATTVAGVPAKVVGSAGCAHPSVEMRQMLDVDNAPG